jgi:hypothetical protein
LSLAFAAAACAFAVSAAQAPAPDKYGYTPPVLMKPGNMEGRKEAGQPSQDIAFRERIYISAEGKVTDVQLEDGGFFDPVFLELITRHTRTYSFIPATDNGRAVASVETLGHRISPTGKPVRTKAAQQELAKVEAMLESGDLARGRLYAAQLPPDVLHTWEDFSLLQGVLGIADVRAGFMHRAIRELRAATAWEWPMSRPLLRPEDRVPRDFDWNTYVMPGVSNVSKHLELLMRVAASQGMWLEAHDAWHQLSALSKIGASDPRARFHEGVLARLQAPDPLQAKVQLDEKGAWLHHLYRSRFRIEQVQGSVQQAELSCETRLKMFDLRDAAELSVPEGWKSCELRLKGSPDTRLVVTEFSAPAP